MLTFLLNRRVDVGFQVSGTVAVYMRDLQSWPELRKYSIVWCHCCRVACCLYIFNGKLGTINKLYTSQDVTQAMMPVSTLWLGGYRRSSQRHMDS